jgi:hypothetical protein
VDELWQRIESSELAFQIGATWWFPLLESFHVLGVVMLLGSLLMVDLRLLGATARTYTIEAMSAGVIGWAWLGFALALVSGTGMFISRPSHYAANPAFQSKLVLLVLAGVNLALFKRLGRMPAKLAAGVSLLLWAGVVVAGRWTGHIN